MYKEFVTDQPIRIQVESIGVGQVHKVGYKCGFIRVMRNIDDCLPLGGALTGIRVVACMSPGVFCLSLAGFCSLC